MNGTRSVPYGVVRPYDGGDVPEYRHTGFRVGRISLHLNWLERRLDTLVRHIDLLREAVRVTKRERPFHLDAWAVIPDHVRYMWTLQPGDDDFSNRRKERISCLCNDAAPIPTTISTVENGCCNWVGYAVRAKKGVVGYPKPRRLRPGTFDHRDPSPSEHKRELRPRGLFTTA